MVAINKNSTTIKFSESKKDQKVNSKENTVKKSKRKSEELLKTIVDNTSNQNKKLDTLIKQSTKTDTTNKSSNNTLSAARAEINENKIKASKIDLEKKQILAELAIQAAKKRAEVQMGAYKHALKQQKHLSKQKTIEEGNSSSLLSRTYTDVKSQQGGPASSTILSMLTGGMINPVIANALGLDKLAKSGVKGIGRLIKKGGSKINSGLNTMSRIWDNKPASETEDTNKASSNSSGKNTSNPTSSQTQQTRVRGKVVSAIPNKPLGKASKLMSRLTQPVFNEAPKKDRTTSIFNHDEKNTALQAIAKDLNSIKKAKKKQGKTKEEKKPTNILGMLGKGMLATLGGLTKFSGLLLGLIPGGKFLIGIFKTLGVIGRVLVNLMTIAAPALGTILGAITKFTGKGLVKAGKLVGKGASKAYNKVKGLTKSAKPAAKTSGKVYKPLAKNSSKISTGLVNKGRKLTRVKPSLLKASNTLKTPSKAVRKAMTKHSGSLVSKTGANVLTKAGGKTAAKAAGKSLGTSVLKKIPGIGLATGLFFGAKRAMAGDWQGAMGEFASGAASTIPGFGTAISTGLDLALAARDMNLSDAIKGNENLNTSNLTDKAYKLQTENVMSEQTLLQQASNQRQEQQNRQLQEQISNTTNNNSNQSIINNTNITSKESKPVYATGDCATTLYNNY